MIYLEATLSIDMASMLFLLRFFFGVIFIESSIFYLECVFFFISGVSGMMACLLNHPLSLHPSTLVLRHNIIPSGNFERI